MEKIIKIDDKDVRLKVTGGIVKRYKAQFRKDFFSEILKMNGFVEALDGDLNSVDFDKIDLEVIYNLIWTMAKTADPNIPEPLTWLDTFEEFPIMDILPEIQDLLLATIGTKKK